MSALAALLAAGGGIASAQKPAQLLPGNAAGVLREGSPATTAEAAPQADREELIAPPPVRKGELVQKWETLQEAPGQQELTPVMSMTLKGVKDSPAFQIPAAKAPAYAKYGTMIPKDIEVRGTVNNLAFDFVKGPAGVDSVVNILGTGGRIAIEIDDETGLATIKPQVAFVHKTYGDVYIYSCRVQDNQLVYDETADIVGRMDANGKITLGGWGLFIGQGENKGGWFYAFNRSEWIPSNGTVSLKLVDGSEKSFNTLVEQDYDNQITIYNMVGYQNPVVATMNHDKSVRITPQLIYTNAMYGPFFNFPVVEADGRASINTAGYTIGEGSDHKITTGRWVLASRLYPTMYVVYDILSSEISTTATLKYPQMISGDFEGAGTEAAPYLIKTADDLIKLAQRTSTDDFKGKHFRVENNIDLSRLPASWQPIGADGAAFEGTFDGNGKTISSLTYDGRGNHFGGLFGQLGTEGTVKNLNIDKFSISTNGQWKAPVVGDNSGTISNVKVTNTQVVSNGEGGGGIAGRSTGLVDHCSFSGTAIGTGSIAGIVGYNYGKIRFCESDATIQRAGHLNDVYRDCAGIAGTSASQAEFTAEISDCQFSGTIDEASGFGLAAGIASKLSNSTMERCVNAGAISHKRNDPDYDTYTGGLAAWISASRMSDCLNSGTIIKSSDRGLTSDAVGGLVGYIRVSYGTTNGGPMTMRDRSTVERCYNSGTVISSSNEGHKGVWGQTFTYSGMDPIPETFTDCWFDEQILGISDETFGKQTDFFTSGKLPANYSSSTWTAEPGLYPLVSTLKDSGTSALASAAVLLSDGEQAIKVKKNFKLSAPDGIIWNLVDPANSQLVKETAALKITGNNVAIKDSYGTELLTARTPDGRSQRFFRIAAVPHLFDGEGTETSPYLVKSAADFVTLDMAVGQYGQSHTGDFFKMTSDIDFAATPSFQGVGAGRSTTVSFGGTFDGDGHRIKNFRVEAYKLDANMDPISTSIYSYAGLFNVCNKYSTIRNIRIDASCKFNTYTAGGTVAGYTEGRVENCRNYADIYGFRQYAGGIVGSLASTGSVENCYNAGKVAIGYSGMGGIVGLNRGLIKACQNDGEIRGYKADGTENSQSLAGGIAAFHGGVMENCVNNGFIKAYSQAGGVIGQISSTTGSIGDVANSVNNGMVIITSDATSRGGLIGSAASYGKITGNYYDNGANINGAAANGQLAGITPLATTAITSGKAIDGLDASLWDFKAEAYPVLKQFADEPLTAAIRTVFVNFAEGQSRGNVTANAPLSKPAGIKWELKNNQNFKIDGNTLTIDVPTGMTLATDTLTATLGDVVKVYNLKSVPSIFDGDGSIANPYLIRTVEDLDKLAEFIDITEFDYNGMNFRLENDIDYNGKSFRVICPTNVPFNAVFNGNNKTISGFNFNNTATQTGQGRFIGLFGVVGGSGEIRNLTLNGTITGNSYCGSLAGDLFGIVDGCVNKGSLSVIEGGAAGLVARANAGSIIRNSRNEGRVKSMKTTNGGIVATLKLNARVENCVNDGEVSSESTGTAGIAGESSGAIVGCRNLKPIQGAGTIAGIVANCFADATEITDCHNEANMSTGGSVVAGIANRSYTQGSNLVISGCTNKGNITGKDHVAGIISYAYVGVQIENCVNYGTISNNGGSNCGGITAEMSANSTFVSRMRNCINYGDIKAHWAYSGGVAGLVGTGSEAYDCYNLGNVTMTAPLGGQHTQFAQILAIGGFAGCVRGHVERCWNGGNVSSDYAGCGGFAGIVQGETQDVIRVERCFNLGDVVSKGALGGINGQAGGLAGYTVSQPAITDFYNFGNITGKEYVGGLVGKVPSAHTKLTNCYSAGKVTHTGTSDEWGNLYTKAANAKLTESAIFYDSDINPQMGKYDKQGYAMSTYQMAFAPLGDSFVYDRASYPSLPGIEADAHQAFATALAVPEKVSDTPGNITGVILLGNADKVNWTGTEHFGFGNGIAYTGKTGEATLTATHSDGSKSKEFKFVIAEASGVDNVSTGKEVESRIFFDLEGRMIANPANGGVYIMKTRYTDGTSRTDKVMVK